MTGKTRSEPSWRALILVAGALVLVAAWALTRGGSGSASETPSLSDAALKAAMVANINGLPSSTAAIPRDASGTPDIAVSNGVLIVTTTDPAGASGLCSTVAAITNSADTGKPLGILDVAIISGGHKVAECRP